MKVKKYEIVQGLYSEHVVESVNDMIEEGWQPLGSIHVTPSPDPEEVGPLYVQAMIKE